MTMMTPFTTAHTNADHPNREGGRGFTLSDFDYSLPQELIAQHPASERSGSRLLDGTGVTPVDRIFRDLPALLNPGDLLVFNDTRVIKARLYGEKPTGGKVELLVERVLGGNQVAAHMRVSKKPEPGTTIQLFSARAQTAASGTAQGTAQGHIAGRAAPASDGLCATLLGRWPDATGALFRLVLSNDAGDDVHTLLARHGQMPLPHYIERPHDGSTSQADVDEDEQRYQTVFAKNPGAVAAPTAALHFDEPLLAALDAHGVLRASVTLHVGAGTFAPVKTDNIADHVMHSEWYDVPVATQTAIANCQARGGRIIAVGTTSVRTLESWAQSGEAQGDTQIFITPGFEFKLVHGLITNFHLPKSTLMMLVSAFAGYERIRTLYSHAIRERYRFYSYGDAMLLTWAAPNA